MLFNKSDKNNVIFKHSSACVLLSICSNTFHILRPTKAPGFVYAWLELISHRIFIARMLAHTPQQKVRSRGAGVEHLSAVVYKMSTCFHDLTPLPHRV